MKPGEKLHDISLGNDSWKLHQKHKQEKKEWIN